MELTERTWAQLPARVSAQLRNSPESRFLPRYELRIEQSYQRCAAAMTQTTLIGGLGLSVFAISTFTPTQRFGVLMLTLLSAALVGDLIFLPALLVSPLGRFLSPSKKKKLDKTVSGMVEVESEVEADDGPQPHLGAGRLQRHDPPHRRKPG